MCASIYSDEKRVRIRVRGQVQGVGFRPFIYQLAQKLSLTGWVNNDGEGVLIEAQGFNTEILEQEIISHSPVLARIDKIEMEQLGYLTEEDDFTIKASKHSSTSTDIAPDSAVCPDCLNEIFDPDNRRFGYPFTNCTNCGPRFTITHSLPYDRANTSMAKFEMCPTCTSEYNNPMDRRFHAQPNCCPDCGPQLSMSFGEMANRIQKGQIIALKGMGGFHLVCDAQNKDTINRLRTLKNRSAKPFAIMLSRAKDVKEYAELDSHEKQLLKSKERPVVLLKRKENCLPDALTPGLDKIGVMLPCTPIQYLLMQAVDNIPLVMTSANPGGEPLVIDNDEAERRLGDICDAIVTYDRDILVRVDDSVVRCDLDETTFIRRARGYTPSAIKLHTTLPCTLALGGYLKNTVCIIRDDHAYVSQHVGDLDNVATINFLKETIQHMCSILRVDPVAVAHDMHPDFASSHLAADIGLSTIPVQHHHAHIAAVMAEHHLTDPVIGVALDGFGLGDNQESWGGELMKVSPYDYERIGNFAPLAQPGGDKAAREPWRMGASALYHLGRPDEIEKRFAEYDHKTLLLMLQKELNSPLTSSAGRLFDAACGLLNICPISQYEGQAPMMLESLFTHSETDPLGWGIHEGELNFLGLLNTLCDVKDPTRGSNIFHATLVDGITEWIYQACQQHNINQVALSGGCLLNQVLAQGLIHNLTDKGLTPYLNQKIPLSDAGLSLGQAWIGAMNMKQEF